jgi:hypothetical protein
MIRSLLLLTLVAAAAARAGAAADPGADEAALRQLNSDYVRAYLACDVARFRAILADDFTGVLADGRIIDKAEFLRQAARPPDAADLKLHDVTIRLLGDAAVVSAYVTYRRAGGPEVRTRYTNVCVRRSGDWRVVWVQWTRVTAA